MLLIISYICIANYCPAQIQLKILYSEDKTNQFPYVLLPDKAIQEKVNNYLHVSYLETVADSSKNPFYKTSNQKTFYQNSAYFDDVSLLKSNLPLFTISFFVEYCGAYCEGSNEKLSFDISNGNLITSKELIAENKRNDLVTTLNKNIETQIAEFVAEIPNLKTIKDQDTKIMFKEQLDLYENCLGDINIYNLDSYKMYFRNDSVIFERDRCSAHVNRAIDDLGNFEIKFSKKQITPYLSIYGKNLFGNQNRKMTTLSNKFFEGRIDKYPIKGIIQDVYKNSDSNDYYFSGMYWYDKIKTPIQISGKIINGEYIIEEFGGDEFYEPTASFYLNRNNDELIGTWKQPNKNKILNTKLKFGL